ncbi:thiamine pyrophosphate-binding protein [Rhodovulum sp. 12E13]|uniref:thiamine pyrophosphate-binding protein n=1 Tax=Rhodovulum sp. 12E13 TaxID=2203891 RepID=UPI001F2DBBE3|nr:thiamine pyrophosphate-binding protein [Rhodovulum sp. 12E13]
MAGPASSGLTTVGPGALNAVNVVENAREDRVPMIVFTVCLDAETAARYTHQLADQRAVFAALAKGHFTMTPGGCTRWRLFTT